MDAEAVADVVVVGGGLAGTCAAIAAAERDPDAHVLLLEKMPECGGSTVLSGGSFAFAGTDLQRANDVADSPELLYADLIEAGQHRNDADLARRYVERQLDTYHWLTKRGVQFGQVQAASGQSVPRSHRSDPRRSLESLISYGVDRELFEVRRSTPVSRLVWDAEQARVTGVRVNRPDRADESFIAARRGVVLACGGFAQDEQMVENFAPGKGKAKVVGGQGNFGDGIKMAWALGAGLRDMPYVKGTFGNRPDAGPTEHTALLPIYKGAVVVNREGRRFANESLDYKLLGDACLEQTDAIGFQVFDSAIAGQGVPGYPIFDFAERIRDGSAIQASLLEELAEKIDVPADELVQTVGRYNNDLSAGRPDQFGRAHLTSRFGQPVRIDRPPYYAYPSTAAIVATYCGVTVTADTEVLDVFGRVLPRLFAVGEMVGGFHGPTYMTGTSLGKASVFGRIAGERAAG